MTAGPSSLALILRKMADNPDINPTFRAAIREGIEAEDHAALDNTARQIIDLVARRTVEGQTGKDAA